MTAILVMKISKVLASMCLIIFSGHEDGTKKDCSVFQLQTGPTRNMQDSATASDYFDLFIDQPTINDIVMFTKQTAVAKGVRNWKPVSGEEMKAFIAMFFISNHVVVPRDERLFLSVSQTKLFHVPGVRNILSSRDRFFELKKYIYFCNPEYVLTEEKKDPVYSLCGCFVLDNTVLVMTNDT